MCVCVCVCVCVFCLLYFSCVKLILPSIVITLLGATLVAMLFACVLSVLICLLVLLVPLTFFDCGSSVLFFKRIY